MKRSELGTGMVLVARNGDKNQVFKHSVRGDVVAGDGWYPLSRLREDLTNKDGKEHDIVEVIKPTTNRGCAYRYWNEGAVIWERPKGVQITVRGKEYSESTIIAALKNHLPE